MAAGLSDELATYQAAGNRGDKNANKALGAFDDQLKAQAGNAFTGAQFATIRLWQQYLA